MLTNPGVKNGILLGVVALIFAHVRYMIDPKMLFNGVSLLTYPLIIYFMYRSTVDEKNKNEGLLNFKKALNVTFSTIVIGNFIGAIYMYLMLNYFDPSLGNIMREVTIENAEFIMKLLGGEDQLIQDQDQITSQNTEISFPIMFRTYLRSLIFPGFVLALIVSAITKNVSSNNSQNA